MHTLYSFSVFIFAWGKYSSTHSSTATCIVFKYLDVVPLRTDVFIQPLLIESTDLCRSFYSCLYSTCLEMNQICMVKKRRGWAFNALKSIISNTQTHSLHLLLIVVMDTDHKHKTEQFECFFAVAVALNRCLLLEASHLATETNENIFLICTLSLIKLYTLYKQ